MNGKVFLKSYVDLTDKTLKAQAAYFASKTFKGYKNRDLLQKAKDLEAELKRATKHYYNNVNQLNLEL